MKTKRKAGEFKATCRMGRWVPVTEDTPADVFTRWDKTIGGNVVEERCDFETGDRAQFVEHMKLHRGAKPGLAVPIRLAAPIRANWKGPKLAEEGQPFKDRDGRTEPPCPRCGMVNEVAWDLAAERWWAEHLELCVGVEPQLVNCIQVGHNYAPHPLRPHCMNPSPAVVPA